MRQVFVYRTSLFVAFGALLGVLYWKAGTTSLRAQTKPGGDPNVFWNIGVADHSYDEFSLGSARSLVYDVAANPTDRDWRERQDAGDSIYKVRFNLERSPEVSPVLAIDGLFLSVAPEGVVLDVNGKRGFFRIPLAGARDMDQRTSNTVLWARTPLRVPIDAALLHQGSNEIGISFVGKGEPFYYDAVRLEKRSEPTEDVAASVEPTIFFRGAADQLKERTQVVLLHRRPLKNISLTLKTGSSTLVRQDPGDDYDFGERVIEFEVPAASTPQPYSLEVKSADGNHVFQGVFRPEKRWKLFAGLKIHNDIGFTDLPQNVEELDTRNIDAVLDLNSKFPFYKFNLETSWLVDNYLHSRRPAKVKELAATAARNQIGVNGFYLNLLLGACSGEEFYRALYFSKSLQRNYGIPMKFACTTDTPSQPWSTPSLLADAGIQGFALGSNQHRGMLLQNSTLNEDSPFYWEGPDGRRVMAWFARNYAQLSHLTGRGRPARETVDYMYRTIPQFLARYRRDKYPVDAVYVYGLYTDNADILAGDAKTIQAWNQAYAYPEIIPATDSDYYSYLAKNFADKLPVFRGDGGAYWHDAVGTTTAATVINHKTQHLLPILEMTAAWGALFSPEIAYPAAEIRDAWKEVLFYDEHTWGAHNSMTQPEEKFVTDQWEFKQAHALRASWAAKNLLTRAFNRLVQNITVDGPALFVFNPDYWPRTDTVEAEFDDNREIFDLATNQPVPAGLISENKDGWRRVRFVAEQVPGLGYKAYGVRRLQEKVPLRTQAQPDRWELDSRYYRIVLDRRTGAIASLLDKELGRELIDPSAPFKANELVYAAGGEQQRIIRDRNDYRPTKLDVSGQSGARLMESMKTPFGYRIRITAQARNVPLIESEIDVYDQIKRIDIQNHIRKDDIRAKEAIYFAFPFNVSSPQFLYQVHNAWARPNEDQLPGALREWFATPNLVVSRDENVTVAFATPEIPLVTLTDINRGQWPRELRIRNGHIYSYVTNNYWSMNIKASQSGDISFRYSITSRKDLDLAALGRFDSETRLGLIAYPYFDWGNVRGAVGQKAMPAAQGRFLEIDSPNAQVTAFKEAEDGNGYIVRLRETAGQDGVATLRSPVFPIAAATLANGVEETETPLALRAGELSIPLKAKRFSTVRLVFARNAGAARRAAAPLAKQ